MLRFLLLDTSHFTVSFLQFLLKWRHDVSQASVLLILPTNTQQTFNWICYTPQCFCHWRGLKLKYITGVLMLQWRVCGSHRLDTNAVISGLIRQPIFTHNTLQWIKQAHISPVIAPQATSHSPLTTLHHSYTLMNKRHHMMVCLYSVYDLSILRNCFICGKQVTMPWDVCQHMRTLSEIIRVNECLPIRPERNVSSRVRRGRRSAAAISAETNRSVINAALQNYYN